MIKEAVYAIIDQILQGDEEFVDRVLKEYDGEIKKERKRKKHTLSAIKQAIERRHNVTLYQLWSSGKERQIMRARRVFTLTAKVYGYPGKEIAAYLAKDPASVSGYFWGEDISREVGQMAKMLGDKG